MSDDMTRGHKDWDKQIAKHEVTTRRNLIFNTGTVHWTTNFELPIHTLIIGGTPGGAGVLTTEYAFTDCTSLKLTTLNVQYSTINANKNTGLPETRQVGLECNIAMPATNGRSIDLILAYSTTTTKYNACVRYDLINKKWQYRNSAGTYTDITDGAQNMNLHPTMFNHMKFIVDHSTHKYIRLMSNDKSWDLSELDIYSQAIAGSETLTATVEGKTDANAAVDFYLDDMTITEEEL